MSEEFVRDQLFLPLRTTKVTGLGVGLYRVKSLIDALGGRIRVESRQSQGTTFWVDLPAEGNRR
jgi:signal transduction histidine kinase